MGRSFTLFFYLVLILAFKELCKCYRYGGSLFYLTRRPEYDALRLGVQYRQGADGKPAQIREADASTRRSRDEYSNQGPPPT